MVRQTPKRGAGGSNPLWDAKKGAVSRFFRLTAPFFLVSGPGCRFWAQSIYRRAILPHLPFGTGDMPTAKSGQARPAVLQVKHPGQGLLLPGTLLRLQKSGRKVPLPSPVFGLLLFLADGKVDNHALGNEKLPAVVQDQVRAWQALSSFLPASEQKKSREPFSRFPARWCRRWAAGIQFYKV